MADFDQFESADPPTMEDDPAADFLAREQDELAGLEDDAPKDSAPQDDFNSFGTEEPASNQDDLFGSGGGGLDDPTPGDASGDFNGDLDSNGPSDAYSAISQHDVVRSEPEKIKKWREEQKERLEKKDAEEVKKKAEWESVAKKELEDWYKHHSEQLTKTHSNNLAAEKAFIKERDESVPGHEWEKICRLCEFNPKVVKSSKDVTRMRSILLQLKQTPLVK